MTKLPLVLALACAACGVEADTRPRTTAYITETVLAPLCGKAECHSTFKAELGYVLDTSHGTATTLRYELSKVGTQSYLIRDPSQEQPLAMYLNVPGNIFSWNMSPEKPMPFDSPMPPEDAAYLLDFMAKGAPGSCDPDAEPFCLPGDTQRVSCGPDLEFVFTEDHTCPL